MRNIDHISHTNTMYLTVEGVCSHGNIKFRELLLETCLSALESL